MNTSALTTQTTPRSESSSAMASAQRPTSSPIPGRKHLRRWASVLLVISFGIAAALAPAGSASATQRLANGAYGNYALDCSYHSAQLTVQGGANGIALNGFKYWIYSVDYGQYVINGQWVPMTTGLWETKSVLIANYPGNYKVYVEYYSYTNGRWYAAGEWTWAQNLVHGTQSLTCRVT